MAMRTIGRQGQEFPALTDNEETLVAKAIVQAIRRVALGRAALITRGAPPAASGPADWQPPANAAVTMRRNSRRSIFMSKGG